MASEGEARAKKEREREMEIGKTSDGNRKSERGQDIQNNVIQGKSRAEIPCPSAPAFLLLFSNNLIMAQNDRMLVTPYTSVAIPAPHHFFYHLFPRYLGRGRGWSECVHMCTCVCVLCFLKSF